MRTPIEVARDAQEHYRLASQALNTMGGRGFDEVAFHAYQLLALALDDADVRDPRTAIAAGLSWFHRPGSGVVAVKVKPVARPIVSAPVHDLTF